MGIKTIICAIVITTVLLGAKVLQAGEGTVTQLTSVGNQLRFWLEECGYDNYYYIDKYDAAHDQAKIILMSARFSGRPVSLPSDCPSGSNVQVTQVDMIEYD